MPIAIREFTRKDLSIVVKLIDEDGKGSYEFCPYTEDRFGSWIQGGKLRILIAEEDGHICGSAAYYDGYWCEEIQWLIAPEQRNRKLVEATLLKEAEKFVKRGTVFSAVDAGSPKIANWMRYGYRLEGGLYHLTAVINSIKPLPLISNGVILRSLKHSEEKELVESVNVGFGTERLKIGDVDKWKNESPPFSEDWVQVAEANGKIVSVVVAKPDAWFNKSFNARRGYLGPASTIPEYRGKNLASALTVLAMNFLFEKGMNSVALYTSEQNVASIGLLQKIGFETGHHWKFMRKNMDKQKCQEACLHSCF
jgi:ribosomal protein S18 acetylase RimI-like enzyme